MGNPPPILSPEQYRPDESTVMPKFKTVRFENVETKTVVIYLCEMTDGQWITRHVKMLAMP